MAADIIAIVIDCRDAEAQAGFWSAALGYEVTRRWRDARGVTYVEAEREGRPMLLFQPVPDDKRVKNRLHLDLRADVDQYEEVDRLVALGARVGSDDPDFEWVLLLDPEDNEFCVLPPKS